MITTVQRDDNAADLHAFDPDKLIGRHGSAY